MCLASPEVWTAARAAWRERPTRRMAGRRSRRPTSTVSTATFPPRVRAHCTTTCTPRLTRPRCGSGRRRARRGAQAPRIAAWTCTRRTLGRRQKSRQCRLRRRRRWRARARSAWSAGWDERQPASAAMPARTSTAHAAAQNRPWRTCQCPILREKGSGCCKPARIAALHEPSPDKVRLRCPVHSVLCIHAQYLRRDGGGGFVRQVAQPGARPCAAEPTVLCCG
mmetsp:Transcript_27803/g.82427  ORF Transcript_27803/g.82427 Transcript_27803/m.82427 type:complete len:223 (+) Transcript_27803:856-1524(+)